MTKQCQVLLPAWTAPRRLGALALLCGSLAGCMTVGPDYVASTPVVPTQWHNVALAPVAQAGDAETLGNWWRQFGDATLDGLVEQALKNSPDLQTAQAKLRESRARLGIADAGRYPTVTASTSARRNESSGNGSSSESYHAGFDASWEIDLFGGQRRSVEAATATVEASVESLRDARVSLIAEVANNYLGLRTLQARLTVARSSLASLGDTGQLTTWRAKAGLVSELDALQAASNTEQTRARIPALESSIETTLNKIAVLIGAPRAKLVSLEAAQVDVPDAPAAQAVGIPADTLRQRADVRAAERFLAVQTAKIGVAEADLYPSLKLSGSIGLDALTAGSLFKSQAANNSLLGALTAPIFNAGSIRRNIDIQNALQEQALLAYTKSVNQALADVEAALVALSKARERLVSLNKAVEVSRQAEQVAQHRYAAGLIDFLSLLDTQRSLLSLEDQRLSAEGDRATAFVQLYKALGGGWQAESTT